ncbi:AraC family transcriptional regulator [Nocardioides sp. GY 10127]|uniref:AraC family transcriptional regulator n=1 Tax=Nocardioides sp. GY 10127 TaxID=2569762 RepID=UPI0014590FEE|nr:AraC family transcriptional regulator [Nocardioides sp. GY 10127]
MTNEAGPEQSGALLTLPRNVFLDGPNEVARPDFDLFRDTLNGHFYPATITALEARPGTKGPRIAAAHLPLTTIGYVRPGTRASVDPGDLAAYHVNVALDGRVVSRCGDQTAVASPRVATVFSPDRHTSLPDWEADAAQLSIKLARTRVEEELGAMLGRPVVTPISFRLAMPVDSGAGARWLSLLNALLAAIGGSAAEGPERRHVELLERALISGLLLSQAHSYADELHAGRTQPAPHRALDRVVEQIEHEPDRPYTVADLAAIAGTSARSLQYAFQERFGLSPMQLVRQVRLDRVHDDLAEGTGTVSEIAAYWGFSNPSRFAQAYRERFKEYPAATLESGRRSRRP